jgi:hypothetical protein
MASFASRAGRAALLLACLGIAVPSFAWAGSTQATLAVSVTVPARCALRVATAVPAVAGGEQPVAMKCTRGTLPPTDASTVRRASAVEPRISREVVLTSMPAPAGVPSPRTEPGSTLLVTVNF